MLARLTTAFTLACVLAAPALAETATIKDFQGQWVGQVSVENFDNPDFPQSLRESGLTVTVGEGDSFTLEWSTVQRESGDPEEPDERVTGGEVTFVPSTLPRRWRADPQGDASIGKPEFFARMDGEALVVVAFTMLEDGKAEMQTFRRTVSGPAMSLSFTRVVDGVVVRRASGTLTRFASP
jgi:hypothetical protein